MSYYQDDSKCTIDDLQKRIKDTDLIPSRLPLLQGIDKIFDILKKNGISSLSDLRKRLKSSKQIESFSTKSGIGVKYLALLRREVESYFPKTSSIEEFKLIPKEICQKLKSNGLTNTRKIYEAFEKDEEQCLQCDELGVDITTTKNIFKLMNLTRIQWVSPLFAEMLFDAGYNSPQSVSEADAVALYEKLVAINKQGKYFKGKIGLRDVKRLINAAKYVH